MFNAATTPVVATVTVNSPTVTHDIDVIASVSPVVATVAANATTGFRSDFTAETTPVVATVVVNDVTASYVYAVSAETSPVVATVTVNDVTAVGLLDYRADALRIEVAAVEVVSMAAVGVPPGVVVLHAAGRNGPGTGFILTNATADGLQWKAPGSSTYGAEVSVAGEGNTYRLFDGEDTDKFVRVAVYASYLVADAWSEIELRGVFENDVAQDDVTASEALAGDVLDYTLSLHNAEIYSMSDLSVWIDAAVLGIEISDDDISYVAPTTEGTALNLGTVAADASTTLYVRRTISAAAVSDEEVLTHLLFVFNLGPYTFYVDARGVYRVFNAAGYLFFHSVAPADPPENTDTPYATAASLPATPTDTFADGTHYFAMAPTNGIFVGDLYHFLPIGLTYQTIVIVGGVEYDPPPSPLTWYLEQRAGGVVRVVGHVHASGITAPIEWAVAYTTDGSTPDADSPDATESISASGFSGLATLEYDLPAQADATVVTVRLQTRRNDGTVLSPIWIYSTGSDVQEITVSFTALPDAPLDGVIWPGPLDVEEG